MDWMTRARRPLAATAAALIAIDLIGLGMHLADAANPAARADSQPRSQARTSVTAPNAVVDSSTVEAAAGTRTRPTTPSGVFVGPVAPPVVTATPPSTNTGGSTPTTTPTPVVPLLQANVGVPALGVNVQLGAGDGSCTTVDLTLLALGDCPAPAGDGAVILQLGGSLLGN
jgi:hypothetical protein